MRIHVVGQGHVHTWIGFRPITGVAEIIGTDCKKVSREAGGKSDRVCSFDTPSSFSTRNPLILMHTKALLFLIIGMITLSSPAALILINFGETSYTSDGSNTWQTVDLRTGSTAFQTITNQALVDTDNSGTSVRLSVSSDNGGEGTTDGTPGPDQAAFDTPAVGTTPTWMDSSSAEQREAFTFGSGTIWTYTLSGFNVSDIVNVEFSVGRTFKSTTGSRSIDLTYLSRGDLLNNADTNGVVGVASTGNLTGETSYTFTLQLDETADQFAGAVNAIGVTVVPEPATLTLAGMAILLGVMFHRKRCR